MFRPILTFAPLLLLFGCINVNVPIPSEFKAELTVNLRMDKELQGFFGDIDQKSKTINVAPEATAPTAKP
jgi:hypothetical protein